MFSGLVFCADCEVRMHQCRSSWRHSRDGEHHQLLKAVKKYADFEELTPGMLRHLIEKIVVHAPDKSSGHRRQQVDIYYNTFVGKYQLPRGCGTQEKSSVTVYTITLHLLKLKN